MEYRKLGNTAIDISLIGLGTMTFGEQNTEADAHQQLDYALAQGINFIDTAEMYPVPPQATTQGATERYIGSWLVKQQREKIILATKAAGPGAWMQYLRNGPRLNAQHIQQALDDSLQRLQTDYIDLYQIHWPERQTNFFGQLGFEPGDDTDAVPIADTLHVLADCVRQGKVRCVGISNESPWGTMHYLQLAESLDLPRIVSVQNPYSLLNRTYEIGMAEISYREQVGLLAYSPLAFGVLSGKYLNNARPAGARLSRWKRFSRYTNPQGQTATAAYVALAREFDLSPAQMALAYVNSRPFVSSNIIGATNLEQLRENIASVDIKLPNAVLEKIETIHAQHPNPCP